MQIDDLETLHAASEDDPRRAGLKMGDIHTYIHNLYLYTVIFKGIKLAGSCVSKIN